MGDAYKQWGDWVIHREFEFVFDDIIGDREDGDAENWKAKADEWGQEVANGNLEHLSELGAYVFENFESDTDIRRNIGTSTVPQILQRMVLEFWRENVFLPKVGARVIDGREKEIDQLCSDQNFVCALYILERYWSSEVRDFANLTEDFVDCLMSVGEMTSEYSSSLAISILSSIGGSSLENLRALEEKKYSQRLQAIIAKPISMQSRVTAILALVPVLRVPDARGMQQQIWEFLVHEQEASRDRQMQTAVMYCGNALIRTSKACMKMAIKNYLIDLAIDGFAAPGITDETLQLQHLSADVLLFIIEKGIVEFTEVILGKGLVRVMWAILDRDVDNHLTSDVCRILLSLLKSEKDTIFWILKHNIVPVLLGKLSDSPVSVKEDLIATLALILSSNNDDVVSKFCEADALNLMLESVETSRPALAREVIDAIAACVSRFPLTRDAVSPDLVYEIQQSVMGTNPSLDEGLACLIEVCMGNATM